MDLAFENEVNERSGEIINVEDGLWYEAHKFVRYSVFLAERSTDSNECSSYSKEPCKVCVYCKTFYIILLWHIKENGIQ